MKKISKIKAGIIFGIIVGIIDVIPMIFLKLTWDANLSAFLMWVIAGFMISTSNLKINGVLKGILISFLLLIPSAVIIGWQQPTSLIPIFIMTLILGSLLGYFINRFGKNNTNKKSKIPKTKKIGNLAKNIEKEAGISVE